MVIFLNIIICEDGQENIEQISRIIKLVFEDRNLEYNLKAFNNYEETVKKYKYIANNIKAENEVWKDFSHLFSMQGSANK